MQYTVYSFNIVNLLNMYIWSKKLTNSCSNLVFLSNKQFFRMRMSQFLKPPATEKHIIGWIQNSMLALYFFCTTFLYAVVWYVLN